MINWNPVSNPPKEAWGYYIVAWLPKNYRETSREAVNEWRRKYGVGLAWYDTTMGSDKKWWFADQAVDDFVTHWAELSEVPVPEI